MKKTIGIIGGMGPLATDDLFHKIIEVTDADKDQEHIRVMIDSNTEIPDRTSAILKDGVDPVPEIVKSAIRLQSMGADVLVMPCNTAHYFYRRILPFIDIPMLHMIEETAKEIQARGIQKAGLLATDGTIQSGVYKEVFQEFHIEIIEPGAENQKEVMDMIYLGVKAGNLDRDPSGFVRAVEELFCEGAQLVILGCTELPIVFEHFHIQKKYVDPTMVLARSAVRFVHGKLKGF